MEEHETPVCEANENEGGRGHGTVRAHAFAPKRRIWMNTRSWLMAAVLMAAASPAPAWSGQDECVLATIGDEKITEAYIEAELAGKPGAYRGRQETRAARRQLLAEILDRKKFATAARREGLDKDEEIRLRIQRQAEQILAEAYVERLRAGVTVDEAESREYYEKNKSRYELPEEFHLRLIVVKEEREANDILTDLRNGADFAEIARDQSVYRSGRNGGDLGWMSRARMEGLEPELRDAAYRLGPGEISGAIPVRGTWHILKLEEYRPARYKPFEDARADIEKHLITDKQAETVRTARERLGEELGARILGDCGKTKAGEGRSQ